jgi:hypothetical protein
MVDGGSQGAIYLEKSDDKAVKLGLEQAAKQKNIIVILASGADASNALEALRKGKTDAGALFRFTQLGEEGKGTSYPFLFKPESSSIENVQVINGAVSIRIAIADAKIVPYTSTTNHHGHHHHGRGGYGYGQYGYDQYNGYGNRGHGRNHHHGHHGHHKN